MGSFKQVNGERAWWVMTRREEKGISEDDLGSMLVTREEGAKGKGGTEDDRWGWNK